MDLLQSFYIFLVTLPWLLNLLIGKRKKLVFKNHTIRLSPAKKVQKNNI